MRKDVINIKKYILGILSILMCFTLVACSSNNMNNPAPENEGAVEEYVDDVVDDGTHYEDEGMEIVEEYYD